jgi:ABC-2 type transport system permease protein
MTATTTAPATGGGTGAVGGPKGSTASRLIKAELLKIWTTNSWWIFAIVTVAFTALALLINLFQADFELSQAKQNQGAPMPDFGQNIPPEQGGPTPQQVEQMREDWLASTDIPRILVRMAANVYTSGQFFTLLFMVVLGALIVTNEFYHQTATATFLTTPHRTAVIMSKLAAAALLATAFFVLITLIDLGVGSAYFAIKGYSIPLTDWPVLRSVLMNLLAFIAWAVLGLGFGVLIRSQLGATLTGAALYLLSFPFAFLLFGLLRTFVFKTDAVWDFIVAVPGVASQIMISPEPLNFGDGETGPQWWVGGLVLAGYAILAGVVGTLITRKRDIS